MHQGRCTFRWSRLRSPSIFIPQLSPATPAPALSPATGRGSGTASSRSSSAGVSIFRNSMGSASGCNHAFPFCLGRPGPDSPVALLCHLNIRDLCFGGASFPLRRN
jgi:hypothetical protein